MPEADGMKKKIIAGAVLVLLMVLMPLAALGGAPASAGSLSPAESAGGEPPSSGGSEGGAASGSAEPSEPTVPTGTGAVSNDSFKILDSRSGEVVTVPDADFLPGAVAAEVPPSYAPEALKAQAVAAYTYYSHLRSQQRSNPDESLKGADFSADLSIGEKFVTDELMRSRWGENYESNLSKIKEAVAPVQGQRLVSEGEYIDATYYAISAGITESSAEIWGGQRSYLTNVASPGDVFASGYQTTAIFTPEDLKESLSAVNSGISLEGEPADWLGEAQRTAAGSVKSITVCGTEVPGGSFRSALRLRSQNFTVSFAENQFTFTVRGYGHGVGMSQVGAEYMANQGAGYREILAWYYPGAALEQA